MFVYLWVLIAGFSWLLSIPLTMVSLMRYLEFVKTNEYIEGAGYNEPLVMVLAGFGVLGTLYFLIMCLCRGSDTQGRLGAGFLATLWVAFVIGIPFGLFWVIAVGGYSILFVYVHSTDD